MNTKKRNIIRLIAFLGITVITVNAQGQQLDEETLQERIAGICEGYKSYFKLPEDARERALAGGLSPEWMTEMLEGMVRKNLPALEELSKDLRNSMNGLSPAYRTAIERVEYPILMLGEFPGPNTPTLLKECIASVDRFARGNAMAVYITLEGANTIPFFREYIAKGGQPRSGICIRLGTLIPSLKEKNKTGEVDKIHAFLLDMIQEDPSWWGVEQIDKILATTLNGYAQSVQREQTVQRFVGKPFYDEGLLKQFNSIRAEVDAVPADKRKDFRAKGELLAPERK